MIPNSQMAVAIAALHYDRKVVALLIRSRSQECELFIVKCCGKSY
ncbi:hypothetical protein FHR92_000408 [Fontibacillus solani]|uniref:Uncharacterized protein n=1 Tax=Fontibacillus solani TaxID=1572857 RepID=A0A7W3SQ10_9BACL|nr:hypothetical protein [Fontibacillus solani]MBA9083954.1 hypothetical protein [Fontibacillus solani]